MAPLVLVSTLTAGCLEGDESELAAGDEVERGYVLSGALWSSPKISVCWENPSASNAHFREITELAVTTTWSMNSAVQFVGWGECGLLSTGLRIRWSDEGPHTKGLGDQLDGTVNGMVLNHEFVNWGPSCQGTKDECVRIIAVHEFGHALAFAHEQNRPDTPAWCDDVQGSMGDVVVGAWDLDSVMNYCNPEWSGDGELSLSDISMVASFYPLFDSAVSSFGGTFNLANVDGSGHFMLDVADIDGDGRADLVSSETSGSAYVWWGRSDGSFGAANSAFAGSLNLANLDGSGHFMLPVADVTGDGQADLISVSTGGGAFVWPTP